MANQYTISRTGNDHRNAANPKTQRGSLADTTITRTGNEFSKSKNRTNRGSPQSEQTQDSRGFILNQSALKVKLKNANTMSSPDTITKISR